MRAPSVILSHPRLGENIGAAARAMANFGMHDLRLVTPKCPWPNEKATAMAVGASKVTEDATLYPTLENALGDLNYVLATTARARGVTKEILTPAEGARRLHAVLARGETCAILFGNERTGLENDEVSLCDAVVTIPTSEFSSINLGQAVLLIAYEWFRAADMTPAAVVEHNPVHRRPTREELIALFDHLERELTANGFLFPPQKGAAMMRALRATIHRARLTYQEVQTIRGMIVAMAKGKHRPSRKSE
ncbi:MAG: RNA methyltransferase [Rhizomicrobium sp.]|jgi:tRNA/rRNA methyltransferase